MRDTIFISHANPEDNEFSRWLALRLAAEGYAVWCDLTKLLGGEAFWSDIEVALRERSAKVLYVLSNTSNHKPGPLTELQVAQNVARYERLNDFVIPLAIDNLPPRQANIALARINSIPFQSSWAAGLAQLLKKLEDDSVPKHPSFGADAVARWWRQQFGSAAGVIERPEEYISNQIAIDRLPDQIFVHELSGRVRTSAHEPEQHAALFAFSSASAATDTESFVFPDLWSMKYPCTRSGSRLISFADAKDLFTGDEPFDVWSLTIPLQEYLDRGVPSRDISARDAMNHATDLLRVGWERLAKSRGLRRYKMATKHAAMFFPIDVTRRGKIDYVDTAGKRTYRKVVGEKARPKRFWHFALSARPLLTPSPVFALRLHVTFSDNGYTIWDSDAKLHSARRSQCKTWWNEQWRDRMLASLQFLAGGEPSVSLALGSGATVVLATAPLRFQSPVSFADPGTQEFIDGSSDDEDVA
jgi:hypothetical protein